jgi:hypothetical protein
MISSTEDNTNIALKMPCPMTTRPLLTTCVQRSGFSRAAHLGTLKLNHFVTKAFDQLGQFFMPLTQDLYIGQPRQRALGDF